jgi:hypothetical protein
MGTRTRTNQGRGLSPKSAAVRLLARLQAKQAQGKILTAEQHKLVDGNRVKFFGKKGKPKKLPAVRHRCIACGTGGHARTSGVQMSRNGKAVRI